MAGQFASWRKKIKMLQRGTVLKLYFERDPQLFEHLLNVFLFFLMTCSSSPIYMYIADFLSLCINKNRSFVLNNIVSFN